MTEEQYDTLPFLTSEDSVAVLTPRKCRRHKWTWAGATPEDGEKCRRCNRLRDVIASRRGKNNRKRGLSLQLIHARRLGLDNLQGNGVTDARSESQFGNAAFVAQMKSGGMFPGWMQRELDYLPRTGGRTPILVVIETPGPGRKARAVVVVDEADWIALHGPVREADRG